MAHLVPFPFGRLAQRLLTELERGGALLDLPRARIVRSGAGRDLAVDVHGHAAATPLGPAAGPHTQLAQNIVLGFLGGARIFELKTVQILDELALPRPCIDMRTVGFNVEWSQELKLEQSLEEYVKASMLLELLAADGRLGLAAGFERFVFDMSVGYDLRGIRHERVRAFLDGMRDARSIVERLRAQLPSAWGALRDLPFRTRISDTLTLSTFHGCPPDEIEAMVRYLMEEHGLHCVVKLNPTLLGPAEARRVFHDVLGYPWRIPDAAFAGDPSFEQALEMLERLELAAQRAGRGLGVKFTNTLVVENDASFLPASEATAYLSGAPLHVLAMLLVGRFRESFGDRLPVSFSGGIERHNFPDAVALGLVPVTVCSDLLRTGGYARLGGYFAELGARMAAVGAGSIDEFVLNAYGLAVAALASADLGAETRMACERALAAGEDLRAAAGPGYERVVAQARLANTRRYVETLLGDARYAAAANAKAPRKVGSTLELFDCLTCDKCVPVCPNHANFTYTLPALAIGIVKLRRAADGRFTARAEGELVIEERHQLANFADFCNDCGNCDVFCPEDGGPYVLKPRFFGSREAWERAPLLDGFLVQREAPGARIEGRFAGREYALETDAGRARFRGPGFELELDEQRPEAPLGGRVDAGVEVDLTYFHILRWLRAALLDPRELNYVNV